MTTELSFAVGPYRLASDYHYDRETHLWVDLLTPEIARCGFDPLGKETSGDIVALSFAPVGSRIERGEAMGSVEAAKFVGPLKAPVSGLIRAHNEAVLANPGLLHQDPLNHWLIEIELSDPEGEMALLIHGEEWVRPWFENDQERFKKKGMIAE